MPGLRLSKQAWSDLREILLYIARSNPDAAEAHHQKLVDACSMLAEHPLAGRHRPEIGARIRSYAVGNYNIFYTPQQRGVLILRLLHSARDVRKLFRGKRRG